MFSSYFLLVPMVRDSSISGGYSEITLPYFAITLPYSTILLEYSDFAATLLPPIFPLNRAFDAIWWQGGSKIKKNKFLI